VAGPGADRAVRHRGHQQGILGHTGKGRGPDRAGTMLPPLFRAHHDVRRKPAERRVVTGCALAPVETGFDRSRFQLRRSDRAGDAVGRSRTICGRLCPLARYRAWWLTASSPNGPASGRAKPAALANCGHRRTASGPLVLLYAYAVNLVVGDIWLWTPRWRRRSVRHISNPPACPMGRQSFSGSPSLSFSMTHWVGRGLRRQPGKRAAKTLSTERR
jgi:hypothetical protein